MTLSRVNILEALQMKMSMGEVAIFGASCVTCRLDSHQAQLILSSSPRSSSWVKASRHFARVIGSVAFVLLSITLVSSTQLLSWAAKYRDKERCWVPVDCENDEGGD